MLLKLVLLLFLLLLKLPLKKSKQQTDSASWKQCKPNQEQPNKWLVKTISNRILNVILFLFLILNIIHCKHFLIYKQKKLTSPKQNKIKLNRSWKRENSMMFIFSCFTPKCIGLVHVTWRREAGVWSFTDDVSSACLRCASI